MNTRGQQADTVLSSFDAVGNFENAKAIESSPTGAIYVVDEAASAIHEFDESGVFLRKHGGPGFSEGQFDGPLDIDPTNGLVLIVADAGNGRIQRFSREFLFLESLDVGDYSDSNVQSFPDQPRYRQNEQSGLSGTGQPIAVATTSKNEMYVIDASRKVVLRWDQDRNLTQIIGDYDDGDGALMDPIALEVGPDGTLFVLDLGLGSVQTYDAFGGYLYSFGHKELNDAVAIENTGDYVLVAYTDKIFVYNERGLLGSVVDLDLPEPLTGLHYNGMQLYILSATKLYIHTKPLTGAMKPGDLK